MQPQVDSLISGTQLVEKVGWIFYNEYNEKQRVRGSTTEQPSPLPLPWYNICNLL